MENKYIRITGNSQGGTSMFLSILDGIEGLFAYPFEPSYERIFNRIKYYNSWEYLLLDYIVGVKDPFHSSYLNPSGIKINTSKKPESISHLRTKLNNIKELMKKVDFKIDRIPPDFPQNQFLTSYLEYLISDLNSKKDCSLENLIKVSSGALKHAFKKTGNIISDQEIFVFKHAISSISRERLEWFNHENKNLKTIFLSRNPFGRLSSIFDYNKIYTKRNEQNFFKRQINKIRIINNVSRDYVRVKKFRNSDNFLIVSFEDLVLDTHGVVQKILKFLNINKNTSKSNQYFLSTLRVKTTPIQNRTDSKFTISKNPLVKWKKKLKMIDKILLTFAILFQSFFQIGWKVKI